MAESVSTSRL